LAQPTGAGIHHFSDRHLRDSIHKRGSALPAEQAVGAEDMGAPMSEHQTHPNHAHVHKAGCGHMAIAHDGHTDYLHDGHLHRVHGDHIDECRIEVGAKNPARCTPSHECAAHHVHGPHCGHESVPHGDHMDYLVDGHLHHPHSGHCDDHGVLG
jgi:hypothetical protein